MPNLPTLLFFLGVAACRGTRCPIACWRCDAHGACSQCQQGWGPFDGRCALCIRGTCRNGACATGYVRDAAGICRRCGHDCAGCNRAGPGSCDAGMCRTGTMLDSNGTCRPCPLGCAECEGSCRACQPCSAACGSCGLTSGGAACCGTAVSMAVCAPGMGRDAAGNCQPCGGGCLRCDAKGPGTCDGAELCGELQAARRRSRSAWHRRRSGAWALVNGTCARCPAGCALCREPERCQRCLPGQGMTALLNGSCRACPAFCSSCSMADRCDTCAPGYGLTDEGTCGACTAHCQRCKHAGSCQACAQGYTRLMTGSCASGEIARRSGDWREPKKGGTLVLPVMAMVGGDRCARLLDVETGQLLPAKRPAFCLPPGGRLPCAFDSERAMLYVADGAVLRQLDLDRMEQSSQQTLEAMPSAVAVDIPVHEVLAAFEAGRAVRVATVAHNGALTFWQSHWDGLDGPQGSFVAWQGQGAMATASAGLRLPQRAAGAKWLEAGPVQRVAAVRWDEAGSGLFAVAQGAKGDWGVYEVATAGMELALKWRCALPGLQRVDEHMVSFLARGRMYLLDAKGTLRSVDLHSCQEGALNVIAVPSWSCAAERAAVLVDGKLHPLAWLPRMARVPAPSGATPHGFGCLRPQRQEAFLGLAKDMQSNGERCRDEMCTWRLAKRLRMACDMEVGQVCMLHAPGRRATPICLPRACDSAALRTQAVAWLAATWCQEGKCSLDCSALQPPAVQIPAGPPLADAVAAKLPWSSTTHLDTANVPEMQDESSKEVAEAEGLPEAQEGSIKEVTEAEGETSTTYQDTANVPEMQGESVKEVAGAEGIRTDAEEVTSTTYQDAANVPETVDDVAAASLAGETSTTDQDMLEAEESPPWEMTPSQAKAMAKAGPLGSALAGLLSGQLDLQHAADELPSALGAMNWSSALQSLDAWTPPTAGPEGLESLDEEDPPGSTSETSWSTSPGPGSTSAMPLTLAYSTTGAPKGAGGLVWMLVAMAMAGAAAPLGLWLLRRRGSKARALELSQLPREMLLEGGS